MTINDIIFIFRLDCFMCMVVLSIFCYANSAGYVQILGPDFQPFFVFSKMVLDCIFWLKNIILYSLCISPLREIKKSLTDSCALSPYRSLNSFSTSLRWHLHMQIILTNTPHSNHWLKKETLLSCLNETGT